MSIKSINEPEGAGRETMLTPASINEPPTGENLPDAGDLPEPAIESLEPDFCSIGDESFRMYVHGTGFIDKVSVIVFAGQDEPTTLEDDGTLSTGINMDYWHGADVVPVKIRNGDKESDVVDFTFLADDGAETQTTKHRPTTTKTLSNKRSRNATR